jgi:phenylalanyl-tRNA synthetase alpha chain
MLSTIENLGKEFKNELAAVQNTQELEALKVKYLGKKSPVQNLMRILKDVPAEQRPEVGKSINDLKEEIANRLESYRETLTLSEENLRIQEEAQDITLPGQRRFSGRKHVITQAMDEMMDVLIGMGFSVQYGPDIETDYYNFEALNFSPNHPARDMQDTFYISPNVLLRTHTSNIQVRVMETQRPPIRIIAPGRAYRNETITARSHVFFHQIELFYVDKGVSFSNLMSTIEEFLQKLFKREVEVRYRPSYFPFVEPGMEVDLRCLMCEGVGCHLCKHTGWLEIAGAGMIHPEVLKNGDIDPEVYSGFAWGLGIERITLLRRGINDIRKFTENDIRFLQQFPGL